MMKKTSRFLTILLILAAVLTAAGPADRIVSIAPSITEEIYLLGAGGRIVADTTYCVYPEEARKKPKIGNILDINLEKIASLKPDIVIGTSINEQSRISRLKDLGIKVRLIPEGSSFREMCSNFLILGSLIGRDAEAARLVGRYKDRLAKISRKNRKQSHVLSVLFVVGTEPLIVAGRGSFIDEIIGFSGFGNAVSEKKAYLRYSLETAVRQDPDIIVISIPPEFAEKEKKTWKRYPNLKAVRNGRIYSVDPDLFGLAVPSRFVKATETLIALTSR